MKYNTTFAFRFENQIKIKDIITECQPFNN